jgi:hypothetical protein
METKDAGTGAAIVVLLAILGLIVIVGVILLMMWKQPGIDHSPSQQSSLCAPASPSEPSLQLPLRSGCAQFIERHSTLRDAT